MVQNSALRLVSSSFANFWRRAASFLACSCAMCAQCLGNARFFVYHQNIVEKAAAVERNIDRIFGRRSKTQDVAEKKEPGKQNAIYDARDCQGMIAWYDTLLLVKPDEFWRRCGAASRE